MNPHIAFAVLVTVLTLYHIRKDLLRDEHGEASFDLRTRVDCWADRNPLGVWLSGLGLGYAAMNYFGGVP